ncbi:MAG: tRNA preQ1(34) S-adenosylmethionine ribosyltransferase-isomerase QueA [candidate division Zixibacteria bacterium]|nr:tRNA preQ1(34) S-adenosylmethionine ribosyltransferase-isomerase QueA [candidate division Zixibacteria bacterium]
MKLSLFDYDLPRELIAQYPNRRRDQSRLMVLDRATGQISHRKFRHIVEYLRCGDALVINNTKVFKARLLGRRATGGQVEVFLVRHLDDVSVESWEALAQPSRRLKEGERIFFNDNDEHGIDLLTNLGDGRWRVRFDSAASRRKVIAQFGHVPLPQYIAREDQPADLRRYQTVFAKAEHTGAVAAPTAGFHLTRGLLSKVRSTGVKVCEITLHVGPGTFKPITAENIEAHTVDPEFAQISQSVADTLTAVRASGGRIFAVGTTSVRTLESAPLKNGEILALAGMVDTYLRPGHRFRCVDHLITNFHLPRSSLLVLVSAFAGREQILAAYAEAIRERYRFYSYGDAMLLF